MADLRLLSHQEVREALRLLGSEAPSHPAAAQRTLRELLAAPGAVRAVLERAPDGARAVFVRLAQDGPASVEQLLDRGWWGRGTLPPPLDWLQRRALVAADDDGLVHAVDEAREGFARLTLALPEAAPARPPPVRVLSARTVVVAPSAAALDAALAVPAAGLTAVAATVAASARPPTAVAAALRSAGAALEEPPSAAEADAPALPLPGVAAERGQRDSHPGGIIGERGQRDSHPGGIIGERGQRDSHPGGIIGERGQRDSHPGGIISEAVGPRAVRTLLQRALDEGRQLWLQYFASSRGGAPTERIVDPWSFRDDLLRGYCHLRSDERAFAVDRIGHAQLLPTAIDHPAPS